MSENTDDLEKTLMLAAAAADLRQYEEIPENLELVNENSEVRYYRENQEENKISSSQTKRKIEEPIDQSSKQLRTDCESSNSEKQSQKTAKRKHDEISDEESPKSPPSKIFSHSEGNYSHSQVVATHYNLLEEKGLDERSKSRIVYMRNFHNWIKSMLINEYLVKIKESKKQHNSPLRVHDMCCGKGGDLLKWKKGGITHLICSDIAEISLEHCKARYEDMKKRARNERGGANLYSIEFISGDCTKLRLREKYSDPSMKLDLLSCQFAFHYSFESLPQAECMMRNAAECLQPGGYFIGTIPDSNEIIARARKNNTNLFGNNVYKVTLDFDPNNPSLFGAKYNFHLDGVVDCPEFLVHFSMFEKLAKKYGLKLVKKEKFYNFFERMKNEGRQLLSNMHSLESYPPHDGVTLVGTAEDDYVHAKDFIEKVNRDNVRIGTLSKSEWEASSLYTTFVFEKVKNTWNADGTPCYNI